MKTIKKTLLAAAIASFFSSGLYAQTPIDLGVVNEDKLIEMLVRTGQIPADASDVDKRIALERYLEEKIRSGFKGDAQFGKKALEQRAKILKVIDKQKRPAQGACFCFRCWSKAHGQSARAIDRFPRSPLG